MRKLAPSAEAAERRGVKILHLNIGQPDIESPKEFWDAIRQSHIKTLEYSNAAGNLDFREKAVEFYRKSGFDIGLPNLITTTAGSEAILIAMFACFNPGDECIVIEPMYANYIGFSVPMGVKIVAIPSSIDHSFALPPLEEFEKRITPRTKGILICSPSNPTGTVYPRETLEALRDLCLRHDLYLIADEVYRDFNYTPEPITSVLDLSGMEQHAVMADSVSKKFSLCGARVGFLISRNPDVMKGAMRYAMARLSPPTLETIGVAAAFAVPQSYFDQVREEYRSRRDTLILSLSRIPGVFVPKIQGAFYAFVRLPIDDSDDFCRWLLDEFQLDGETVMLAPGTGFYVTPGMGKDEVRIAYVLDNARLKRAILCLEEALKVYPGRKELVSS